MTLSKLQKERLDGSQLVGFHLNGETLSTEIEDTIASQKLYHFVEPIATWRSVDSPNSDFIVSWKPDGDAYSRLREWRGDGLSVPDDVTISTDTLALLDALNGTEYETKTGSIIEISIPPLSRKDSVAIKSELMCRHGIHAIGGYGIEPLRLDEDGAEKIHQLEDRVTQ